MKILRIPTLNQVKYGRKEIQNHRGACSSSTLVLLTEVECERIKTQLQLSSNITQFVL